MSASRSSSSGEYLGGVEQEGAAAGLPELPPSQVYKLSCEYFSRPMLEPQVRGKLAADGLVVSVYYGCTGHQHVVCLVDAAFMWAAAERP